MKPKKILILLPDGIGLRNFAFTSFVEVGKKMGWEVVFWNNTAFELSEMGYSEMKLKGKALARTDLLKRAKIEAELDHFSKKSKDPVYQTYKFPASKKTIKSKIKNVLVSALVKTHRGEKGLLRLRNRLKASERNSDFYKVCIEVLKKEQPDFVFCTNQRPVNAIAPLTAAEDLNIPTGTFIFSWDNLPKATMIVEPDHYFVWSDYMKQELLSYYPFVQSQQVHVTGSPQFEPHFNPSLRKNRNTFFAENGLDPEKKYICYSGDDVTTSPDDPEYLKDVAEAVEKINLQREQKLGIIFRCSPVDLSDRYEKVLEKYKNLIVPLAPSWINFGKNWNEIYPTKKDLELQINTILHSEMVINLASSMVFDFAVFDKPCLYLNYNVENKSDDKWFPQKVYDFVHFRSMPSKNAVIWLNSKEEIKDKLELALSGASETVAEALNWFRKINQNPAEIASERIWEAINELINNE